VLPVAGIIARTIEGLYRIPPATGRTFDRWRFLI
jgi:hypothetical protein